MDRSKDMSSDMMNTSVVELLEGISFPASKAEVLQHLEAKGAPPAIVDKIRSVNAIQFESLEELRVKTGV